MEHASDEPGEDVEPSTYAHTEEWRAVARDLDEEISRRAADALASAESGAAAVDGFELQKAIDDRWKECVRRGGPLGTRLSEKLRMVLVPREASRLAGEHRTGRRLNMRKVVQWVASDFRRDKIWLRRTRPARRRYQLVCAIDDSALSTAALIDTGVGNAARFQPFLTICA